MQVKFQFLSKSGIAMLALALSLYSCGNNKESAPAAEAAKVYKTVILEPLSATLNTDFPASIQGQQNIDIRPKIDGYIEKIFVDEGAVVKTGQPLFKIFDPQYEQALAGANAGVKTARAEVSTAKLAVVKAKPLVEREIVSKYELEAAQLAYESALASLAQAEATLATARTNLSYTMVLSPVNGVVGSIPYRLGSLVSSSTTEPLTTVSSIGNVYAYFAMNEKVVLSITKDSSSHSFAQKIANLPNVSLVLSDGSVYGEKGKIETVNGIINTATGSANIRARFGNARGILRSGSSTTVRLPNTVSHAIIVPQSATFELQDKIFAVTVGKDGKSKSVGITIMENTAGNFYVVTSGLKAGDQIVTEGVSTLKDGSAIKPNTQKTEVVYASLNQ